MQPESHRTPLRRLRTRVKRLLRHSWAATVATELTFRFRRRHVAALVRKLRALPRALHIEATNACNARCVFCAYDQMQRPKVVMGMPDFERVVDQYVAMGGSHVSLTPIVGDPFVDPHLFARLDRLAQTPGIRGFYFFTNAILMTPEASERLLALGERLTVCVSLGGFDAPTYERVMGVDRFETVWENLRAFVDLRGQSASAPRLEIHLRCPESRCAGPRWAELHEWESRGLVVLARIDTYDSWAGRIDRRTLEAAGLKARPMPYKRGACELLYMKPVVLADGEVNACACRDVEAELRVGNLDHQSLEQVWKGTAVEELVARHERGDYPDVCRRCTYYVSVYNPLESRIFRPSLNWRD